MPRIPKELERFRGQTVNEIHRSLWDSVGKDIPCPGDYDCERLARIEDNSLADLVALGRNTLQKAREDEFRAFTILYAAAERIHTLLK